MLLFLQIFMRCVSRQCNMLILFYPLKMFLAYLLFMIRHILMYLLLLWFQGWLWLGLWFPHFNSVFCFHRRVVSKDRKFPSLLRVLLKFNGFKRWIRILQVWYFLYLLVQEFWQWLKPSDWQIFARWLPGEGISLAIPLLENIASWVIYIDLKVPTFDALVWLDVFVRQFLSKLKSID